MKHMVAGPAPALTSWVTVVGVEKTNGDWKCRLRTGRVQYVDGYADGVYVTVKLDDVTDPTRLAMFDEGNSWIRGKYDETTPEAQALLVTFALLIREI